MLPRFNDHYTIHHKHTTNNTVSDLLNNENYNSSAGINLIDHMNNEEHNAHSSRIRSLSSRKGEHVSDFNLISFIDDTDKTPIHSNTFHKEKQIADFQQKMLEEFRTTCKINKREQKEVYPQELELEYQNFFDKIECKHNKVPSTAVNKLTYEDLLEFEELNELNEDRVEADAFSSSSSSHFTNDLDIAPKILVPRLHDEYTQLETGYKELDLNEDLIDEVMFEKNIENLRLSSDRTDKEIKHSLLAEMPHTSVKDETPIEYNKFNEAINELSKHLKGLAAHQKHTDKEIKLSSITEIPQAYEEATTKTTMNKIDSYADILEKNAMRNLIKSGYKEKDIDDTHKNSYVGENQVVTETRIKRLSQLLKQLDNHDRLNPEFPMTRTSRDSEKDPMQTKINIMQEDLLNKMVTEHDMKYLETVKMIEKTFQKRSVLKSDSEKSKLTPGPGLIEKATYLPHIMARVQNRETYEKLKEKNMKLILKEDPGVLDLISSNPTDCNPNTLYPLETLMADCNKERLKAFEAAKLY